MLEPLGALSILMSWVAGFYLLTKWRGTKSMSISQHAASTKHAYLLFAATLTFGGSLLYVFILDWFMPHLGLGFWFGLLYTVTFLAQLVAAWVPDTHGLAHRVHFWAAYFMAFLFMPLALYVTIAEHISLAARIVSILCLGYMFVAWIIFVTLRKAREKYLVFQALYIVAMQVVILAASYIR